MMLSMLHFYLQIKSFLGYPTLFIGLALAFTNGNLGTLGVDLLDGCVIASNSRVLFAGSIRRVDVHEILNVQWA